MEKGLTYSYILPWSLGPPPKGQKTTIGHQANSLDENMTRPTSYKSESVDFRSRWARMKPLGENVDSYTRICLFNHVSTRILGLPPFSLIETSWVLGKVSWRLLGVLETLPSPSWVSFFPFLQFCKTLGSPSWTTIFIC